MMLMQIEITIHCDSKKITDFLVDKFAEKKLNVFVTNGFCRFGAGSVPKETRLTHMIYIYYMNCIDDLEDIYDFNAYKEILTNANSRFRSLFQAIISAYPDEPIPIEYSFYPSFYEVCKPNNVF